MIITADKSALFLNQEKDRCSPGVPAEQHSPVCNHARVNTSQPPVPPLCLTAPALRGYQKWLSAPALRGYWKIDIDSLSSSCTTFSDLSFARGALRRVVTPVPALASSETGPGVPAEQHSPVCNHARVSTSQPPVPPLCLTAPALLGYQKWLSAPALRGYWKIDIDSLSSSCTTFSDLSFARGALRRVVTPAPALASSEVI
ncbi:hypothetical protein MRX96_043892 [Rhipicephalus microplus]